MFSQTKFQINWIFDYTQFQQQSIKYRKKTSVGPSRNTDKKEKEKKTTSRWRFQRLHSEHPPWSQHSVKFSGRKSCESGDIILSICQSTNFRSCNFRGLESLISLPKMEKFGDHTNCDMGDLIVVSSHVILHEHFFKRLCNFLGGSPSP